MTAYELFLLLVGLTFLGGVLLLSIGVSSRSATLNWWGCAYLVGTLGLGLIFWRSLGWYAYGLGGCLVLLAYGIMATGLRHLSHKPNQHLWLSLPAILWGIASVPVWETGGNTARMIGFGICAAFSMAQITWELMTIRDRPAARLPLIAVTILHLAFYLTRSAAIALDPAPATVGFWLFATSVEAIVFIFCDTLLLTSLVRAQQERKLQTAADTDFLTKVLNRGGFTKTAEAQLLRGGTHTLLLLDVDHFKALNDKLGHPAGDAVLRELGRICRASTRNDDVVGRLGGDEFVILIRGTAAEGAIVAQRVRQKFRLAAPVQDPPVTVCIGISDCRDRPCSLEELLAQADIDLYRVKTARRKATPQRDLIT